MFLLTNTGRDKERLLVEEVCGRTVLRTRIKMAKEAVVPVQYFTFVGSCIRPSKFVPLKVFTLELIRHTSEAGEACTGLAREGRQG